MGAPSVTTPTMRVRAPSASRARDRPADPRAEPDRHVQELEVRHGAKQLEHVRRHAAHERTRETTARSAGRRSTASAWACSYASWKSRPCSIKVAPSARIAAFFSTALPRGTTIVVGRPKRRAANGRSGRGCRASPRSRRGHPARGRAARGQYTSPPRGLNEPAGRWFSCLTQTSVPPRRARQRPGRSAASAAEPRGRTPRRPRAPPACAGLTSSPAPRTFRPAARAGRPRTGVSSQSFVQATRSSAGNSPAPRHSTFESWCARVIWAVRAL